MSYSFDRLLSPRGFGSQSLLLWLQLSLQWSVMTLRSRKRKLWWRERLRPMKVIVWYYVSLLSNSNLVVPGPTPSDREDLGPPWREVDTSNVRVYDKREPLSLVQNKQVPGNCELYCAPTDSRDLRLIYRTSRYPSTHALKYSFVLTLGEDLRRPRDQGQSWRSRTYKSYPRQEWVSRVDESHPPHPFHDGVVPPVSSDTCVTEPRTGT